MKRDQAPIYNITLASAITIQYIFDKIAIKDHISMNFEILTT